jgi:hypothetical protein
MKKRTTISLFIFIVLILGIAYISIGLFNSSKGISQTNSANPSNKMDSSSQSMSPYSGIFIGILKNYSDSYYSLRDAIYGEYLWNNIDPLYYNCTLTRNITLLSDTVGQIVSEYKNLSRTEVEEEDTVGILLLGDIRVKVSFLASSDANELSAKAEEVCLMKERLSNFDSFQKKALIKYGRPSFSFEELSNLSSELKRLVSRTYGGPFSGEWPVDARFALQHFVYVASQNESLIEPFMDGYTPQESAELLKNLTKRLESHPYARALLKPSLVYLAELWREDSIRSKNQMEVDDRYLKIFWAWYNMVRPERFLGGGEGEDK